MTAMVMMTMMIVITYQKWWWGQIIHFTSEGDSTTDTMMYGVSSAIVVDALDDAVADAIADTMGGDMDYMIEEENIKMINIKSYW